MYTVQIADFCDTNKCNEFLATLAPENVIDVKVVMNAEDLVVWTVIYKKKEREQNRWED